MIERFKKSDITKGDFITAWAEFALSERDFEYLELLSSDLMILKLLEESPRTALRIYEATGRRKDIEKHLERLLARGIERGPSSFLLEIGSIYAQMDRFDEYEKKVRQILPPSEGERFFREIRLKQR